MRRAVPSGDREGISAEAVEFERCANEMTESTVEDEFGMTDVVVYCRSRRYVVFGQYESIWVRGLSVPGNVRVGYFMGAPCGAAMSQDDQWLLSAGNGLVAYRLQPPWRAYGVGPAGELPPARTFRADPGFGQWWEAGRGTKDELTPDGGVLWLTQVRALRGRQFLVTTARAPRGSDADGLVAELIVDADKRTFQLHREWKEEAQ